MGFAIRPMVGEMYGTAALATGIAEFL